MGNEKAREEEMELNEAKQEIEKLRMQLVACGVAAMCNTQETKEKQHIDRDNPYWSASYADVCAAVEREIILREENEQFKNEIIRCASELGIACAIISAFNKGLPSKENDLITEWLERNWSNT